MIKLRIRHILIALDQLIWSLLTLGAAFPNETISSSAYKAEANRKIWGIICRPIIDLIFLPIERHHCQQSYVFEHIRHHAPREI